MSPISSVTSAGVFGVTLLLTAAGCTPPPVVIAGVVERVEEAEQVRFEPKSTDVVDVGIQFGPAELSSFRLWFDLEASENTVITQAEVFVTDAAEEAVDGLPTNEAPDRVPLGVALRAEASRMIEVRLLRRDRLQALADALGSRDDADALVHVRLVTSLGASSETFSFPFSYCRGCLDFPSPADGCPGGVLRLIPEDETANQGAPAFVCDDEET